MMQGTGNGVEEDVSSDSMVQHIEELTSFSTHIKSGNYFQYGIQNHSVL